MRVSEEIKVRLPILEEFQRDGHELRKAGKHFICLCPFHQERSASCHVTPDNGRFHCFGCGSDGTVIDYHSLKQGIPVGEAIAELALRLQLPAESNGDNGGRPRVAATIKQPAVPRGLPKLPDLQPGSTADLRLLAKSRNISLDALRLATSRGLLWFSEVPDGPTLVRAWIITDRTRKNAQARRLDGRRWQYAWNAEAKHWEIVEGDRRSKVTGFKGNWTAWPVGIEEAQRFDSIAILEGVDLLAAFHFLIIEGCEEAVGPVAILGASNRIPSDVLNLFAGKRVRIFPHVDSNNAGLHAAAKWETQLRPVAASVSAFDFTGLIQINDNTVLDLNDLTSISGDCFESEPDLQSIMDF
jgi:hypothetical protein